MNSLSQEAYRLGMTKRAAALAELGHKEGEIMHENNRKAAKVLYSSQNTEFRKNDNVVDLHGLYVKEATAVLKTRLRESRFAGLEHLILVTGNGIHSPQGRPVLKEAVSNYLSEKGYMHHVDVPSKFD